MITTLQIRDRLEERVPAGTILDNPGRGNSKIKAYGPEKLSYVRGTSTMYLAYSDIADVYESFKGKKVSSIDLKAFRPQVFDSSARPAGHSCNCTMVFMLLEKLDLSGSVEGAGVRGNPFSATLC